MFQALIIIHQSTHEFMDPARDYSKVDLIKVKCFYVAISMSSGVICIIFTNINTIYSSALIITYLVSLIYYMVATPEING